MPLDSSVLRAISEKGVSRSFPKNMVLVHEGDVSDTLFIILSGAVRVYTKTDSGKSFDLVTLGPGEYFGKLALDGRPRAASVVTTAPTTCTIVAGRTLREFIVTHPDFGTHLIYRLIGRIREMTSDVKGLAYGKVYQRLVALLNKEAVADQDGRRALPPMTQQDIANRVGSTRPMITILLRDLKAGGYISVVNRRIFVVKHLPANW
jgi:CRP/FNR family transcriptional regulator, cyclic AMP receptor protein